MLRKLPDPRRATWVDHSPPEAWDDVDWEEKKAADWKECTRMPVQLTAALALGGPLSTAVHREPEPTRQSELLTVTAPLVDAPTPSKVKTECCRYFSQRGF